MHDRRAFLRSVSGMVLGTSCAGMLVARAWTAEAPPARNVALLPRSQLVAAVVCEVNRHSGIKLLGRDGVEMTQQKGPAAIATAGGKWEVTISSQPIIYQLPRFCDRPNVAGQCRGENAVVRFRLVAGGSPECSVDLPLEHDW